MNYIKALFDIQRTYTDGANMHYELFYKVDNTYERVTDTRFKSILEAREYINNLLNE